MYNKLIWIDLAIKNEIKSINSENIISVKNEKIKLFCQNHRNIYKDSINDIFKAGKLNNTNYKLLINDLKKISDEIKIAESKYCLS